MSTIELERLQVIKEITDKGLKQSIGMKKLDLSKRQMIRLMKAYRQNGEAGLLSKRRGQVSNRQHKADFKELVRTITHQAYADFGPTFASEKLLSVNKLKVNKETLRQWMVEWGLWQEKPKKALKLQQSRMRRSRFGELIQIDGSHHDWFEGRGEKCCLLVFIDDATSRLVGLRFEATESREGYFKLCRSYIEQYGRPLALYSDKAGTFRVNQATQGEAQTQFGRAMSELDIELICAHSPQAKGRVERANGTLQDRLVKEMRLRKINDIESANTYLPTFMADYNHRFAVKPRNEIDAHRSELPTRKVLDLIFSFQSQRKLSKQLEMSYNKRIYQVQNVGNGYRLRYQLITVCEAMDGQIHLLHREHSLAFTESERQQKISEVMDKKSLEQKLNQVHARGITIPPRTHPWKKCYALTVDKKLRQDIQVALTR